MAYIKQIGLTFELKRDWKMLFTHDTWFMWQDMAYKDGYVLRRFTLFNVFKWYFYQFVIWLLMKTLHPLVLMADHYYWKIEGEQFKEITRRSLFGQVTQIKFFRLGKTK